VRVWGWLSTCKGFIMLVWPLLDPVYKQLNCLLNSLKEWRLLDLSVYKQPCL